MENNIFIRILIAVVVVVILFAVIPPLFSILNLPQAGALARIIELLIAGAALYYIIKGKVF